MKKGISMIHIVVPHFQSFSWLALNLENLCSLADNADNFQISIIEMSGDDSIFIHPRFETNAICRYHHTFNNV